MCAYNEAAVIVTKACNLVELRARTSDLQILVYVDGATDDTAALLEPYGDTITVIVNPTRQGKTYGMHRLVEQATGDILMFTDANTVLDNDVVERLRGHFADPEVGCVCGYLQYRNPHASATSAVNSAYWRLEENVKRHETKLGCVMGADGSLFAVRRTLYPEVPDDIIDDLYVSLSVLCAGFKVIRAADVRCYELSVVDRNEEFQRKVRISCQAFNVHRLLWPRIRRLPALQLYCYVSHRLLRWFTVWTLAGGLLFGAAGLIAVAGIAGAMAIAVMAVVSVAAYAMDFGPIRKIYEIWLAFLATGLGVVRSLRGDRFRTWAPAQSIRQVSQG